MRVEKLPINYSELDRKLREGYLQQLAELQKEFQEKAKPFLDCLAAIDASYAPRYVLFQEKE